MVVSTLSFLALAAAGVSALTIPAAPVTKDLVARTPFHPHLPRYCQNGPNSRQCWGQYNINTNYYDTVFHTGHTVEYWLNIQEVDCAPDGYVRKCMTANGTMPGPAIVANWGDEVVIHVTNSIPTNGTAIHWHGVRQLHNTEFDGVPGMTQCPIAPGQTFTYRFHASQYGTSLYHSHFSLQYTMGVYGPIIVNGPATANYDTDLGEVFMSDWDHTTTFQTWNLTANEFNPAVSDGAFLTGVINGMNTGNCTAANATSPDPNCIGPGKKFSLNFQSGKRYRLRVVNIATEAWFQFSIDGHKLTVISTDFVPIVPYTTDSVRINIGQRYDIVVAADAVPGNYWLRSGFIEACVKNGNAAGITGIVRYDPTSTADPTSNSTVTPANDCADEPVSNLVPWLAIDVPNTQGGIETEDVTGEFVGPYLRWQINHGSYMWTNWSNPALGDVLAGNFGAIPASDNVFVIGPQNGSSAARNLSSQYTVLVIDDQTPQGFGVTHPIHLHGHDFMIVAQSGDQWDGTTNGFNFHNPPRRDVALLPGNGHLAIAFPLDNPGVWAIHCHIAWHSSQGFAATLVESPALIGQNGISGTYKREVQPLCNAWNQFSATMPWPQDDAGI